jgi:hypothetical protein
MKKVKLWDVLKIRNGMDHKHLAEGEIPVYGSGGVMRYVNKAMAMFDEWHPESLGDSRYYWLPVRFTTDNRLETPWRTEAPVVR